MHQSLICYGDSKKINCRLGDHDYGYLPVSNVLFDLSTKNNLSSVSISIDKKKGYYIHIDPDEESSIICNKEFGKYGMELRCKAIGPHTPDFPEIWEHIIDIDEIQEAPDEVKDKVHELYDQVLNESFPDIKDKVDYLKIFVVPKLKGKQYAYSKFWVTDDNEVYPLIIGYSPEEFEDIDTDPVVQQRFIMDTIHELTHIRRAFGNKYTLDVGTEEGETIAESLVRGDWVIRINYPFPDGYVEEIVYVKRCVLPKQYCFESLKDARDFEEFNYELISGEDKPKTLNPQNTPDWDDIESRVPVAPIVDMLRGMEGSYNVLTDISEYWLITTSPSGKRYLYKISDLHIDGQRLSYTDVLEGIDELDAIQGNEDIEKIWDYP